MPNGTWIKGVDARPTQAPAVPSSGSSSSSSSEDVVEKPPRHRQLPHGKELALEEPPMKKKKLNNPPAPKCEISMREPPGSQQVVVDWSDDDEDACETLQWESYADGHSSTDR